MALGLRIAVLVVMLIIALMCYCHFSWHFLKHSVKRLREVVNLRGPVRRTCETCNISITDVF
jgi:hypothetical protein